MSSSNCSLLIVAELPSISPNFGIFRYIINVLILNFEQAEELVGGGHTGEDESMGHKTSRVTGDNCEDFSHYSWLEC